MDSESKTFLEVFRKVLDTIPVTSKIQEDIFEINERLKLMKVEVGSNRMSIESLQNRQDEQDNRIDAAERSAHNIEGSMLAQLQDASKQMHEEILIQRNTTRVDLNTMKQNLGKSLNEAISKLANTRGTMMPRFDRGTPTGDNGEAMETLWNRVKEIEETLNIQGEVNQQLNAIVQNDATLHNQYIEMADRVDRLEAELKHEKDENVRLGLVVESVIGSAQELSALVKKHEQYFIEMLHHKVPRMPEFPVEPSSQSLRLTETMAYLSSFDHVSDIPTFPEFPNPITTKPASPNLLEAVSSSRGNSAKRRSARTRSPHPNPNDDIGGLNRITEIPVPPHSLAFPPDDLEEHARTMVDIRNTAASAGTLAAIAGGRPSAPALQQSYQAGYQAGFNSGYDQAKDLFQSPEDREKEKSIPQYDPSNRHITIERPKPRSNRVKPLSAQMEGDDEGEEDVMERRSDDGVERAVTPVSNDELEQIKTKLTKIQETQKSMQLANKSSFKSIATVVEELKAEVAALKARPAGHGGARHHSSGKVIAQHVAEDPENALEEMLMALRALWAGLIADIAFGLDYLSDKPKSADNGMLSEITTFLEKCDEFVKHLDFGAGHSASELLIDIHPILDELTLKALHILRLDESAQNATKVTLCLGDILCENEQPQLREKIIGCLDGSVEALDSKLNKIDLRRRLDNLELFVQTRAAESYVDDINSQLRAMITVKADMAVVEEITATKASIKELRRLKDRMINQMDSGIGDDGSVDSAELLGPSMSQKVKAAANQEMIDNMTNKFDLLYKQFQDLRTATEQYVPRDEVQEAMKAVIHEVKALKSNAITTNTFTEALKRKADELDVQRLIQSLTEAMGNVEGRTSSSIVHTKCLVCDAPVNSIIPSNKGGGPSSSNLSPPRGVGYDKRLDANLQRPSTTMLSRSLTSASGKIKLMKEKDRVRMSADLRIIRNSMDLLPPLDTNNNNNNDGTGNFVEDGQQQQQQASPAMQQPVLAVVMNAKTNSNPSLPVDAEMDDNSIASNRQRIANQGVKERIRSSAGGGMGLPNYKNNTR